MWLIIEVLKLSVPLGSALLHAQRVQRKSLASVRPQDFSSELQMEKVSNPEHYWMS
jgi:hypothetical protein